MKKICLIILVMALCACAKIAPKAPEQISGEEMLAWDNMLKISSAETGPYRLSLSMRFGEEGNTRRVTGLLWGNGDNAFRLDVMAGVGATVAMISDDEERFLVYAPRENKAYFHEGESRPLLKVGVPVPINLSQLADLLTGRYAEALAVREPVAATATDSGFAYKIDGPLAGDLTLLPQGRPVSWRQNTGQWTMEIGYDEDSPNLPERVRLKHADGKLAVILVKTREAPQGDFTPGQLKLNIPAGTPLLPLSEFKSK